MSKNPHASNNIHIRSTRNYLPRLIRNKGIKLVSHGMAPIRIEESILRIAWNGRDMFGDIKIKDAFGFSNTGHATGGHGSSLGRGRRLRTQCGRLGGTSCWT